MAPSSVWTWAALAGPRKVSSAFLFRPHLNTTVARIDGARSMAINRLGRRLGFFEPEGRAVGILRLILEGVAILWAIWMAVIIIKAIQFYIRDRRSGLF